MNILTDVTSDTVQALQSEGGGALLDEALKEHSEINRNNTAELEQFYSK